MEFHEAAAIFPLDEEHLAALVEDIRQHGLQVPIETLDGKIIDGRRRWLACKQAGVKPEPREVHPDDPVAYVLSMNLHRRQLSVSQRAMVGDNARAMYEARAEERMLAGKKVDDPERNSSQGVRAPETRDQVGALVGVSGDSIDKARRIRVQGIAEVVAAVEADKISLNVADKVARLSQEEQPKALQKALAPRARSPQIGRKSNPATLDAELQEGVDNGVGVSRAHEAINCLRRIPKNDRLRKRGFQIVTDWIKHNP
jgi:ParB-like chromosome segregation protein Spo0J